MSDATEPIRREMVAEINAVADLMVCGGASCFKPTRGSTSNSSPNNSVGGEAPTDGSLTFWTPAITSKGNDMRQSLTTRLNDAGLRKSSETLRMRVTVNDSAISIFPEGYGDFGSAPDHGCPIFLELYRGRLRLVVFADINDQEPTIIDLETAREDQHVPCEERTPAR